MDNSSLDAMIDETLEQAKALIEFPSDKDPELEALCFALHRMASAPDVERATPLSVSRIKNVLARAQQKRRDILHGV